MSAFWDAYIKERTAQPTIAIKKLEALRNVIDNDIRALDLDQQKIYIKTMIEELAVITREANISRSEFGVIMRKIKEASDSIGIKGSDFLKLIPTKLLSKIKGFF